MKLRKGISPRIATLLIVSTLISTWAIAQSRLPEGYMSGGFNVYTSDPFSPILSPPSHRIERFVEHQANMGEFHLKIEVDPPVTWRKELLLLRRTGKGANDWEVYARLSGEYGKQNEQLAKFTRDMLNDEIKIVPSYAGTFGLMMWYKNEGGAMTLNPNQVMGTRITYKWKSQE